ncbi:MAG: hypothetical protein CL389_01345 [Acidiferrobacteraceae bacterium]|jgi:CRP-like cAMP-binding protein|nr:hypothetical protein [Acidiferrobacteraceae bacterium]|tara:strand:+ start:7486 stop:8346 length:861 start_codon:yes stop_codon:yes gene_type:complete
MLDALKFFESLPADDVAWLLTIGREEQVIMNTAIIRSGEAPSHLFIVLDGLLGVEVPGIADTRFRNLGPGELVGEMSMLDQRAANVSVVAAENTLLLAVPQSAVLERMSQEPDFAARFYRSIALLMTERARMSVHLMLERLENIRGAEDAAGTLREEMLSAVKRLKVSIDDADQRARANDGTLPAETRAELMGQFRDYCIYMDAQFFRRADVPETLRNELGAELRREFLPYLLLTDCARRCYEKPCGYAGDFETIRFIYAGEPRGRGTIGELLDAPFLAEPAAVAV